MKTWSVTFLLTTGLLSFNRVSIEVEINESKNDLHAISHAFRKFEGAGITPAQLDFVSVEEVQV